MIEDSVRGPSTIEGSCNDVSKPKQIPEKPKKTIVPIDNQSIEGLASRFKDLQGKDHLGSQADLNTGKTTKAKKRKHSDLKEINSSQYSHQNQSETKDPSGDETIQLQQEISSGSELDTGFFGSEG